MPSWKRPELPPLEQMPVKRPGRRRAGLTGRVIAGVAGVAFLVAALAAVMSSLEQGANRYGSFRALALLLPAIMLLRYAWTGRIKV